MAKLGYWFDLQNRTKSSVGNKFYPNGGMGFKIIRRCKCTYMYINITLFDFTTEMFDKVHYTLINFITFRTRFGM